jgi:NADH:ubiquinone reductase (H+-translocating)
VEQRVARGGTLILGGGFAGGYVGRLLKRRGATIVSLENFMLYTPLLPEAASGTIEPRHVVVPLREMCPHAELVLGRITGHDHEGRIVTVDSLAGPIEIAYERLVVALGATTRTLPVPGLAEHGMGFKDLADAIALRNHVLLQLERASIHPDDPSELGFVFVGAGYAGVEALAELNDMAHAALRSYPDLRGVPQRWVLVDAAPKILPEIPRGLGTYAARRLAERGVEIHVGTTLESYDGTEAVLGDRTRSRREHSSGRPVSARAHSSPTSGSHSTLAVGSSSTRRCESWGSTAYGRSATAPP